MLQIIPEKRPELVKNGTVKALILLLHSHSIYQSTNRSRKDMIDDYLKDKDLKTNIIKALRDIANSEHEFNSDLYLTHQFIKLTPTGHAWELEFFNHFSIFKILEKIRMRIHSQYCNQSVFLPTNKHHPSSCIFFSRFCYKYLKRINKKAIGVKDVYGNAFEKFGGPYVLIELLQAIHIHREEFMNDHHDDCEKLTSLTVQLLCTFSLRSPSMCRQLAQSPFHITMFVKLIRKNSSQSNGIIEACASLLTLAFSNVQTYESDTLQNCQAIQCLTELMMNTDDQAQIKAFIFEALHSILLKNEPARREFYQIEGAIPFVVSEFVNTHSWILDGGFTIPEEDKTKTLTYSEALRWSSLYLLTTVTRYLFPAHLDIQSLYRKANVSSILVGFIKLIPSGNDISFDSSSFEPSIIVTVRLSFLVLYYMLKASQDERSNISVEVEFFRKLLTILTMDNEVLERCRLILELLENN